MTGAFGTGPVLVGFVVGAGLAAWGGVLVGAPEKAFVVQHLLLVRDADLTFLGVFTQWIGGAMAILGGAIVTGRVIQPEVGPRAAFGAALLVLALGVLSFRYARRNWGEAPEIVDHY